MSSAFSADDMVLVCVSIPGKAIVKSSEHVNDVDAAYNSHLYLYIYLYFSIKQS